MLLARRAYGIHTEYVNRWNKLYSIRTVLAATYQMERRYPRCGHFTAENPMRGRSKPSHHSAVTRPIFPPYTSPTRPTEFIYIIPLVSEKSIGRVAILAGRISRIRY